MFEPYLYSNTTLVFVPAVLFSSLYGGMGPGLLATILSVLANTLLFMEPRYSFKLSLVDDAVELAIFSMVALLTTWLNSARRRAEQAREAVLKDRLNEAISEVKALTGLLPICGACKKIRDDKGYWNKLETYIQEHSGAEFTHSICPDCMRRLYPQIADLQ